VVLAILDLARAGRFAEIRDRFTPSLQPMVTAEAITAAWDAAIAQLGPVVSVGDPASGLTAARVVVRVPVRFQPGELALLVSVIASGELAGLQLGPAGASEPPVPWEPPPYTDPNRFGEQEVTLGEGPLAVPNAHPAEDLRTFARTRAPRRLRTDHRDSTIANSKPLKDLAWGLASRGIAVLRFDKVTHAHPDEVKADRDFTVVDEYLPHAIAALRLLRAHAAVDSERVFLAGHSLGGTITPRIATADPSVAGLVILAGGAEPLQWAAVRQFRYLALDPTTATASEPAVDTMTAQARQG
jgi:hypothetical protein